MRHHDWPERLAAYIAEREARPFKWGKGEQDCCSFADGGVVVIAGESPMADIPDYASAEEADVILATPLAELVDARMTRRQSPGFAQRGDVVMAQIEGHDALLICEGPTLVGPGRRGLVRLPRSAALIAWAVE